ncbi:hypothetical protein DES53_107138 [Roseimicrobium gellanilyticum]|uniref:Uncharacterized protein n=1 Tax=Roseimicrobium gellanilyticum TaxID=748857 RepID=A0A366HFJ5_9BACT|nr:hypothetical protein [Roseimicrobium gellanilyticum]RBP41307.1 hypothetical protein DES53_107138 [Roseimicrobium gellanilyticum]
MNDEPISIGGFRELCCSGSMTSSVRLAPRIESVLQPMRRALGLVLVAAFSVLIPLTACALPDPITVSMSSDGKLSVDGSEVTTLESPAAFVKRVEEINGSAPSKWSDPKRDFYMFSRLGITVYHDRGDADVVNVLMSMREGKDLPMEAFVGRLSMEGIDVPRNASGQFQAQDVRKALKALNPEPNDKIDGPNAAVVIGHLPYYDYLYFSAEPNGRIKEVSLGIVLSKGRLAWMRENGDQLKREALKRAMEKAKP